MIRVPKVEMHIAHMCNLRCAGCSHYADYGFNEIVPLAEGGSWLSNWGARIEPLHFTLLGGEPLLNPQLLDYLRLASRLWARTQIRLVTNGLLLPRWGERLWPVLTETRAILTVSIHSREERYWHQMVPILEEARHQSIYHGFILDERNSIDQWYYLYHGQGPNMMPFNEGNPEMSWKVCRNKHCVTLQNNALWKCPPIAHLPRVAAKFRLDANPAWRVPLSYQPMSLDASDDDIRAFFAQRSEPICGMCPTKLSFFEKTIY